MIHDSNEHFHVHPRKQAGSARQWLINIVQARIGTMDSATFEDFCYELLLAREPGFENIQHSNSLTGKTRRGKCDLHVYHHSTHQVTAVTCTTQWERLGEKALRDLNLLKESKFADKIRTVLACIASNDGEAVAATRVYEISEEKGWKFELRTLQRLAREAIDCDSVMRRFFSELMAPATARELEPEGIHRKSAESRLFLAGGRLKRIREDLRYNEGQFIESVLNYPSQLLYREVENERIDIEEHYLAQASRYSGADFTWLKLQTGSPYPGGRLRRYSIEKDLAHDTDPLIEARHAFLALEPTGMQAALLIEESAKRWSWWRFDDLWDIWNWTQGDERHVPEFLRMLNHINRACHPMGLIVTPEKLDELLGGQVHPANWREGLGPNRTSEWFDDLFDYNHRHAHLAVHYAAHGAWFLKMQEALRLHGSKKAALPAKGR